MKFNESEHKASPIYAQMAAAALSRSSILKNKNYSTMDVHQPALPQASIDNRAKHQSMFIQQADLNESNLFSSNSDYLLNSETLYRNEIRKSIRNVLQQKRSSTNLINTPSASTVVGAKQDLQQSSVSSVSQPTAYFYQTTNLPVGYNKMSSSSRRLIGSGIYLTSTQPTIVDNQSIVNSNASASSITTVNKVPTITTILTSTICAGGSSVPATSTLTRQPVTIYSSNMSSSSPNGNGQTQQYDQNNYARPVLYLDKLQSSAEYESRV